jgi:hypothetical protein
VTAAAATVVLGGLAAVASPAYADTGGVVISELHYHPASDLDTDDFLELVNTSAAPVDVSGWSFSAGITAVLPAGSVIPAGGYYVLAADAARFTTIYGFAPDVVYTGKLSNGGEQVTVVDSSSAVVDSVVYADADPWPAAADGTGPSLELRGLSYDNTQSESWGPSSVLGGTPRTVNSLNGTPPQLRARSVVVTPQVPLPGQQIGVSAQLPAGSTATLAYKVMFGPDVVVPFLDDAASPGGAGDGIFAATIPGQAAGQLVRWRIDASAAGNAFAYPVLGDTVNYEGVVVGNPGVTTALPVFEFFMEDAVLADLRTNHRYDNVTGPAVVAWKGQVVDNATMRVRGNTSRAENEVNWKVELPKGRTLDMRPLMPYALDEFALQSEAEPLADLGWNTVNGAGARGLTMFPVRTQRNGGFFSVAHIMETEDGTWRDAKGVSNWAIYKGEGGALTRTTSPEVLAATTTSGCPLCVPEPLLDKKTREGEDFSDVWQLTQMIDAPPSAAQREWISQNVNVPAMVNYMAINSVIRHADSGWYNWFAARDTDGTGRWELWHWDLNWIFTTPEADGKGTFLTPDTSNRFTRAMLAYPDISEMFYRRLRTLADQFLLPGGKYEAMWDGIANPYVADWNLDKAAWGGYSPAAARSVFVQGLQDRYAVIQGSSGPGKPVPASQAAAPDVLINEIQYAPTGGVDAEFIELTNPSATESVDLSGWTVDGIGLTIQPGTVLLPGKQIVFVKKDTVFRATYAAANRYVGGQYTGDLSDSGETLRLMQGARVVDEVTYAPTAPWPTAAAGTGPSLELVSSGADNALPGSWTATSQTGGTPAAPNTGSAPPPPPPPSNPVLYSDTFTGADGAAWAPAWTTGSVSSSATLSGGAGALTTTNTSGAYVRTQLSGAAAAADTDLVTSFQWNSANPSAYLSIFVKGSGGWLNAYRPSNGYGVELTPGSSTVALKRVVNGTTTTLASTAGAAQVGSGKQWLRLRTNGSTIQYRIWANGAVEPSTWTATVTDTSVAAAGRVHLSLVRATSATEVKSVRFDDLELRDLSVPTPTDTTPPTAPGALSASGTTQTQTTLSWGAATDNVAVAGYQVVRDGTVVPGTVPGLTWTDTGLVPGSTHTYAVRAIDTAGLTGPSTGTISVTTSTPPVDTTPPSAPGTLSASGTTQTQTTLSWGAATDDVAVAGYQVTRDGVLVPGTVTALSWTDTGLAPGSTHTYSVRAIDTSGLVGPSSSTVTVTTSAASSVLYADLFTGTTGSPWASAWTTSATAGAAAINADAGRLSITNTAGAFSRAQLSGPAAAADADLVFSYRWNSGTRRAYFSVFARGSGGWANVYRPMNGYGLEMSSDSTTITVKRSLNGTVSNLATASGARQAGTAKQWVRLRVKGSTIQFRTWVDGAAEPSTWRTTVTDTGVTAPGRAHLSLVRSSNSTEAKFVDIDDLQLLAN